jgi:hypothetical protein
MDLNPFVNDDSNILGDYTPARQDIVVEAVPLYEDTMFTPTGVRNISNSEVTTFLSCKRQYEFNYGMELQPKKTGDPLARGSFFHLGMELYWRARMEGMTHDQAMKKGLEAFNPNDDSIRGSVAMAMEAQFLWIRYMNFHKGFPDIEPLGTENQLYVQITPTIQMAIKYDFYFREISTGKYYIKDYKLAYEFWKDEEHDLNGQMPKYISVLQANGFRVDGGYLEEIRTRKLGAEKASDPRNLWKRTAYKPTPMKKAALLKQHISASLEIEKFRALPPEEREAAAIPVLNKHGACKFCNFTDLCISMLDGKKDLSVDIRVGYTQNTYVQQYNPKELN